MKQEAELDTPAIALHWAVAITILFLIATGLYMTATESWRLYPLHKSFGTLLFALAFVRAVHRLRSGWPRPASTYQRVEQLLSKGTHWALLIGSIAVPLMGMLYSGASGHGFGIFGLVTIVPANHSPADPNILVPYSEYWALVGQRTHRLFAYTFAGLIALHVVGALKHHLLDRDRTLLRMLGKGRLTE